MAFDDKKDMITPAEMLRIKSDGPAPEIPKNKMTVKLSKCIQTMVFRLKQRESYFAELDTRHDDEKSFHISTTPQPPPPRESAVLTTIKNKSYLLGGLNYEAVKDIFQVKLSGDPTL